MAEDLLSALGVLGFFFLALGTAWANDRWHQRQRRSTPDL